MIFLTDCMVFIVENLKTGNMLEAVIKQKMFSSAGGMSVRNTLATVEHASKLGMNKITFFALSLL